MYFNPLRLLVSGLITLVVVGFGGYKAFNGMDTARDSLDEATASAADESSLLRASNLSDALATVKEKGDGRTDALAITIYPGYITAEVSKGSEKDADGFKINQDGDVQDFPVSLTGPGKLSDNVFPLADIDPKVLDQVIAGAIKKDAGLKLDDVTHAIVGIDPISGKADWKVYFNGASYYTANLDGSDLRKGGTPSADAATPDVAPASVVTPSSTDDVQKAADAATKQADTAMQNAKSVTDCLQKAAGNVAAVQACTQ
ncbi:MAG: hypothetical protein JHC95_12850 [Solirubrobacteraceae bacterium]|nr:hypothetical protein [Solirubrobacteraceae bacterium]